MGDGLQNNTVACIIQARMSSSRLPGKIVLPVPLSGGKPMLLWIIEALRKSKYSPEIIVATSENDENDVLETFCSTHGVQCFRGDENDVFSRFIAIVKANRPDTVVRLTADNPLVDVEAMDDTIAFHLKQKNDYTKTDELPLGMNFEVVSTKALLKADAEKLSSSDREHVTLFIRNSTSFKNAILHFGLADYLKELRLTVDYPSDFLLVSAVLALSANYDNLRGLKLVQKIYNEHPWLFEANAMNVQKRQFSSLNEEVIAATETLQRLEFQNAASILKAHEEKDSI